MNYLNTLLSAVLLLAITVGCQSKTQVSGKSKADKIEMLLKSIHEKGKFNGTILVSEQGKIIYKNAFGLADKKTGEPLKIESSFYLASVSKQFTSMAIMMLKEKNRLTYEDRLSKYFPEFPTYANGITIKQLMTHTSGIPDHFRLGSYKTNLKNSDVLEVLLKQEKTDFTPGDKFSYSNGGYVLLAMIAEKASGLPYNKFIKESILEPLGMKNTLVFDESKPVIKNRAIGYNRNGKLDDYEILTTGAGGMYSTVEDLYLWEQSLNTDNLVSKESIIEAFSPTVLNNGEISNYGYGWSIDVNKNSVAHAGGLSGFRTFIKRDLNNMNCYILLTNFGDAVSIRDIEKELDEILITENLYLPSSKLNEKKSN